MWPANCRRASTTCSSGFNYDNLVHRPQVCADRPASTFSDENSLLSYLLCLLMADLFYYMVHGCSPLFSGLWAAHAVHLSREENHASILCVWGRTYDAYHCCNNDLLSLIYVSNVCVWDRIYDVYAREQLVEVEHLNLHRIHHCLDHDLLSQSYASIFCVWGRIYVAYARERLVEAEIPEPAPDPPLPQQSPDVADLREHRLRLGPHLQRLRAGGAGGAE